MQQDISVIRGTTHTVNISVTDIDGNAYTLQNGEILRFGVKGGVGSREFLIKKEIDVSAKQGDAYVITLSPSDTKDLPCGNYFYDVGLQSSTQYFNIIECSNFRVKQNITGWEANHA